MVARHLSLLVPGALGPLDLMDPAQLPTFKTFSRLLGRGDITPAPGGLEALLFERFRFMNPHSELPVAALTYAMEKGIEPDGWCMRADPAFLVPGRTSLMMMGDGADLGLQPDEVDAVLTSLNQHFAEDGLRFEATTSNHWYVFGPEQEIQTHPLSEVMGLAVQQHLPQGRDGLRWHGVLAEVQMLLHSHPVNQTRSQRGLPQLNSLWFWGAGRMPVLPGGLWQSMWSDASLPAAMALAASVPRQPCPADAEEWLEKAESGSHLILLESFIRLLPDMSPEAWAEVMSDLEVRWWQPLWRALRRGRLQSLSLYPVSGQAYYLTPGLARRWWRRPVRLHSLLETALDAQAH
ncbi:MAG: hypothetical protein HUJ29_00725 [Gammaproteobacteria bacterium]|nr:hypothetical protein [Gammaproteobacteria bacterium]